jgi:hypothetical protein
MLDHIHQEHKKSSYKFKHLGKIDTIIPSVLFVINKYPNAYLIKPKDVDVKNKCSYVVKWIYKGDDKFLIKFPDGFVNMFNDALTNDSVRFIVILVSLSSKTGGRHANSLIYDKRTGELERFDPLGPNINESYSVEDFDNEVFEYFTNNFKFPKKLKYIKPIDYCPSEMYQIRELDEIAYDDMHGNCAVWRLWYIDIKLANQNLNRKTLIKLSLSKIELFGSFQRFIKAYQIYITNFINKPTSEST